MLVMAKKKKAAQPAPAYIDPHKGVQINFRVVDPRMLEITEQLAAKERRSRNFMLNLLVEQALTALGLWPPKGP